MPRKAPEPKEGLRVTVQYRTKHGNAYELASGTDVLAVHIISPAENASDSSSWHVEARGAVGATAPAIDGWGATAAEALHDAGRAWVSQSPALAPFNWEAVARELHAVRAI
jgi:hypothetical protein